MKMRYISLAAGDQIIDALHLVFFFEQAINKMQAQESHRL
jgi:hypothetical protein